MDKPIKKRCFPIMKKRFIFLLMIILVLLIAIGCGTSEETTAAEKNANTEETKSSEDGNAANSEHRIISTTVALTEITDALELDLVGVPTTYKDLPEVGLAMEPDME